MNQSTLTGVKLTSGDPPLALGSPARDAAIGSSFTTDQRGFPIIGSPDIGPYDAGIFNSYETWIRESLPATATTPESSGGFDFDGDGQSNEAGWTSLTHPANGNGRFHAATERNGPNLETTLVPFHTDAATAPRWGRQWLSGCPR